MGNGTRILFHDVANEKHKGFGDLSKLEKCWRRAIPAAPTAPKSTTRSRATTTPAGVFYPAFVPAASASTRRPSGSQRSTSGSQRSTSGSQRSISGSRGSRRTFRVGDKAKVINAANGKLHLDDEVTVTRGVLKGQVLVQKGEGRPIKIAISCLRLATSQGSPRQKKSSKASSTSSSKANNLVWEGMQVWKNDKKSNLRTIRFNEAKTAFAVYGGSLFMSGKNRKNITLTNIDTLKMDGDKVIIFRKGGKAVKPCVITGPTARQFAEFLRGLLDADQIEHASFQITEATMFGRRRLVERLQGF